ncbi:LapA family protein [Pyramidobacter piscolens]|uniref:LapA family protein n=1 Tax=Pyramidobacter piscolens TaxID=638849 RepID=UPI002AB1062D|nr:LapA family protein [Pyramidobacter piscolens]
MRSYGLGLGFVAIWAATYAVQNQDILAVRFLAWDFALSQGLWEIFLFFFGIVVMWLISLAASWEGRFRSRREIERARRRIAALEKERGALLAAMKAAGASQKEITFIENGTSL